MKRAGIIFAAALLAAWFVLAAYTAREERAASAARLQFEKHVHTCAPGNCLWEDN